MGMDIRILLGLMFTTFGCILVLFGWLGDQRIYERSLGININLLWGTVLIVFGLLMLVGARFRVVRQKRPKPVGQEIPNATAVSDQN